MALVDALPFVAMLLGISVPPIVVPHRWERSGGRAVPSLACSPRKRALSCARESCMARNKNRGTGLVVFVVAVLSATRLFAADLFELKAETVHCASPDPLVTGHIYPATLTGCELVHTPWALVGTPKRAALGVMKVDMGGAIGVRYVSAYSIVQQ